MVRYFQDAGLAGAENLYIDACDCGRRQAEGKWLRLSTNETMGSQGQAVIKLKKRQEFYSSSISHSQGVEVMLSPTDSVLFILALMTPHIQSLAAGVLVSTVMRWILRYGRSSTLS